MFTVQRKSKEEEDASELPKGADEHFGSLDMTSPPEQKETPAADAGGNVPGQQMVKG